MSVRAAALGLALWTMPLTPAKAQVRSELFLGATAAYASSEAGSSATHSGGMVLTGGGLLAVGRVHLEVGYAQGTMDPRDDRGLERSLVDAHAALGVRITDWLTAQVGARARGRASPHTAEGVERWTWGDARVRLSTPLVGSTVLGELSVWQAVGLGMNIPHGGGTGRGGEAGLRVRLPGDRLWVRITYGVDQVSVPGVGRRDTLDGVALVTGVSFP